MTLSVILAFVLGVVARTLAGSLLRATVSTLAGKQLSYLFRAVSRVAHLRRGQWLCPECEGVSSPGKLACLFCLWEHLQHGLPAGYVRWRTIRQTWDWRNWRRINTGIYYPSGSPLLPPS